MIQILFKLIIINSNTLFFVSVSLKRKFCIVAKYISRIVGIYIIVRSHLIIEANSCLNCQGGIITQYNKRKIMQVLFFRYSQLLFQIQKKKKYYILYKGMSLMCAYYKVARYCEISRYYYERRFLALVKLYANNLI